MSQNKELFWWMGSILTGTCLLIAGVIAHDHQIDKCIVDHIFDFHLDADHAMQDIDADKFRKEVEERMRHDNNRRCEEWAEEMRGWYRDDNNSASDDRGTLDRPGDSRD